MTLCLISLDEVTVRIPVSDLRTAQKWCEENGIKIYRMHKKKCIYNVDLENTLETIFITSLKEKYPMNYKEIYDAIKRDDFIQIHELQNSEKIDEVIHESTYKAMGENAQSFQKIINGL